MDLLVKTLSKRTKLLLLRRHEDAPLSTAIKRKNPELAAKAVTHLGKRALLRSVASNFSSNKRHQETQLHAKPTSGSISPNRREQ